MNALWQIILAILWRLRPVQALEVNLRDIIEVGLSMFADDLEVEALAEDPAYRQTLAAALADAHRKLDLLIYLRACELTGTRTNINGFTPNYSHTHASTDLTAIWRSFQRLIAKFDDYERYACLRAERLRREKDNYPVRLAASLQSISPVLCAVDANHQRTLIVQIASLSAQHWGRWIARACAQDGGGARFFARGPPFLALADISRTLASQAPPARMPPHIRNIPKSSSHISPAVAPLSKRA